MPEITKEEGQTPEKTNNQTTEKKSTQETKQPKPPNRLQTAPSLQTVSSKPQLRRVLPSPPHVQNIDHRTRSNDKNLSVFDRISPVAARKGGMKVCVYGSWKTGKTTFACTFPKPVLVIGTEDGTDSVVGIDGLVFVRIYASSEFDALIDMVRGGVQYYPPHILEYIGSTVRQPNPFKTVVLDTGGGLQDIILKEFMNLEDVPITKSYGITGWGPQGQQNWSAIGMQLADRVRKMLDLADTHFVNAIMIAHERSFKEDGIPSDVMSPKMGAALTPLATTAINRWVDFLCQTYVAEGFKIDRTPIEGTDDYTEVRIPTGRAEFRLRTLQHSVFQAGIRAKTGSYVPEYITNPTYDKLMQVVRGEWKEDTI